MRRKYREMNTEFALNIIDKCKYSVLAVISSENLPYAVPLSPVRIENNLYFHCAYQGKKIEALKYNPNVCIVSVGDIHPAAEKFTMEYESAITYGAAVQVTDRSEKVAALKAIALKYTPENIKAFDIALETNLEATDVWKIRIESVTAKRNKLSDKTNKQ